MAIRPFANAPHASRDNISANWLIGVQTGQARNAEGIPEMKYLTVSEFTEYVKSTYGAMWHYRGEFNSATPSDPMPSDYFVCTGNFTEGGQTYVSSHVYAYNGSTWDDVSNIFDQYTPPAVADNNPTLSWGQQSTVATIGGTDIHVTMPEQPVVPTPVPAGVVTDVTANSASISIKAFDTATLQLDEEEQTYSILELGTDVQLSFLVDGVEQQSVSLVTGINVTKTT